jgi:K+-transporting ATPase KdpF subunit
MSALAARHRGRRDLMDLEYILGGILALGLMVYLIYALLVPERF